MGLRRKEDTCVLRREGVRTPVGWPHHRQLPPAEVQLLPRYLLLPRHRGHTEGCQEQDFGGPATHEGHDTALVEPPQDIPTFGCGI